MSWEVSTKGNNNIPLLDDDVYNAVCYQIIDLGTQNEEYEGKTKHTHKVWFSWAVEGETVDIDGKDLPRVTSQEYTLSLGKRANLRAHLEGWRGKQFDAEGIDAFDISKVLGTSCRLLVGKTGTGKSNKVKNIMKAKHSVVLPDSLTSILFQIDDFDGGELPDEIPNFLQEKIKDSPEYRQKNLVEVSVGAGVDYPDDDESEEAPF